MCRMVPAVPFDRDNRMPERRTCANWFRRAIRSQSARHRARGLSTRADCRPCARTKDLFSRGTACAALGASLAAATHAESADMPHSSDLRGTLRSGSSATQTVVRELQTSVPVDTDCARGPGPHILLLCRQSRSWPGPLAKAYAPNQYWIAGGLGRPSKRNRCSWQAARSGGSILRLRVANEMLSRASRRGRILSRSLAAELLALDLTPARVGART
jgi:hypothetical protein